MLTSIIPLPYRLLAFAILAAALFGFGWVKGAAHVQSEYDGFVDQVAAAGKSQAAKAEAIKTVQTSITAHSEAEYAQGDPALRNLYGPGRVRDSGSGIRPLPAIPGAAIRTHGNAADVGPSSAPPSSGEVDCAGLRSDSAVTTRQLLFLQEWVEQQQRAMSSQ